MWSPAHSSAQILSINHRIFIGITANQNRNSAGKRQHNFYNKFTFSLISQFSDHWRKVHKHIRIVKLCTYFLIPSLFILLSDYSNGSIWPTEFCIVLCPCVSGMFQLKVISFQSDQELDYRWRYKQKLTSVSNEPWLGLEQADISKPTNARTCIIYNRVSFYNRVTFSNIWSQIES